MVWPKGKGIWYLGAGFIILLGFYFLWGIGDCALSQDESTCISCHTSVRDLVKITREIAAKAPPEKSTASEGEG